MLDDICSLQKWVDTLLEGIETLKSAQEERNSTVVNDLRCVRADVDKIKNDERALGLVEQQVEELSKLISA